MTRICHITDKRNLTTIIQHKGLYSKNKGKSLNISYINIAYEGIQERRSEVVVPINPSGVLHDYVPFYFAPRSPMLYAIKSRIIPGYKGNQEDIIYLISDINTIASNKISFVFTDGHPIMAFSNFYNDLKYLKRIYEALEKMFQLLFPGLTERGIRCKSQVFENRRLTIRKSKTQPL